MDCILHSPEFHGDSSEYNKYIGSIFTYGGASFIESGTNFYAAFDFVPLLNPRNVSIMMNKRECVHYTSFRIQSPFAAHEFEGPSYQEAFQFAIHQK